MIVNLLPARKAISALLAGMAFCILSAAVTATAMGKTQQKIPASTMYSEADMAFLAGRNQDALDAFQKFLKSYPDASEVVAVRYKIACIYIRMGNFQDSISASMEWLNLYPDNPLKIEVMSLLGSSYNALENRPESFRWMLAALKVNTAQGFQDVKEDLKARTIDLIKASSSEELEKMAGYGSDSEYAPYIYHRLASISLEEERPDDARNYTMLLVRSSNDETWVSIGRELLERLSKKTGGVNPDGTITVGCLLPLSGPFALYGQDVLNGIQLGMDIFSSRQEGLSIELVIKDTMGEAEIAAKGVEGLVNDDNVTVIVGPLASGESTAAAKKAQELGVPIITLTQKDGITKEGDMVFRNFLIPSKEIDALLKRAITEMGRKKFAIFYPDKTYGRYMKDLFREKVSGMGGTVTAVEAYKPDQTDFGDSIKNLVGAKFFNTLSSDREKSKFYDMTGTKSEVQDNEISQEQQKTAGPELDFEAVFIPDNYQMISLIAPQFPYYGIFNVPFLGTSLWMSEDLIASSGTFVQGAIFPAGFFLNAFRPGIEEFVSDHKENFQTEPDVLAASGYDTIRLIRFILNKGNATSRKDFQKALFNVAFDGVTGEISFDEKGEVKKEPLLLTVKGEEFRAVD
jgi:branched-chain amino acid transport system substrate-binding protein